MEITQTASTASAATQTATASTQSDITSDFETFLKMLTVQLQNQDPLNPVESSDYAVQLATFSQVEQAVLTNDLLTTLTSQMNSSGLAGMADWVGKEAKASAPAYFDGNPISLSLQPDLTADRAELVVRNADGVEVQRLDIPVLDDQMEWAGVSAFGEPFEAGVYSFDVLSISGEEVIAQSTPQVYNRVDEVRLNGNDTILILEGGVAVSTSNVTALREAS